MRELNSVDGSLRSNDISNVRDGRSRGGSEVEDLLSGCDVDLVETTEDTGRQLRSERVPDSVLGLDLETVLSGRTDGDSLLEAREDQARRQSVRNSF